MAPAVSRLEKRGSGVTSEREGTTDLEIFAESVLLLQTFLRLLDYEVPR